MKHTILALALGTAISVSAQKMPLANGGGLIVQVHAIDQLLPKPEPGDAKLRIRSGPAPGAASESLERLAAFLRNFAAPQLGPGEAIAALGDAHLVVLAAPDHAAHVERVLEAMRAHGDQTIAVEIKVFEMARAFFEKEIERRLPESGDATPGRAPGAQRRKLFGKAQEKEMTDLLDCLGSAGEGAKLVTAPRLLTRPLEQATISVGEEVGYVRDFDVGRAGPGQQRSADPILDKVFDGTRAEVIAASLGDGQIAVTCSLLVQCLERPIPTFQTTLGVGHPVEVQLPRTTGVRMRQSASLENGGALVLAAEKKSDGKWLLAIVTASSGKN